MNLATLLSSLHKISAYPKEKKKNNKTNPTLIRNMYAWTKRLSQISVQQIFRGTAPYISLKEDQLKKAQDGIKWVLF